MTDNVVNIKGGNMGRKVSISEPILQWFAYSHLPAQLREASKPFADLAIEVVNTMPKCDERDMCLRKLLEAKDCAVRATISGAM
jgi:hypothetical protein